MQLPWREYPSQIGVVAKALEATRPSPPNAKSVKAAIAALEAELTRFASARDTIDTKAALVPAGVGAIGSLVADQVANLNSLTTLPMVAGIVTAVLAVLSVIYAIAAVLPHDHRLGGDGPKLALGTGLDDVRYQQGVANALALAVLSHQELVRLKGDRLAVSLMCSGGGVIALVVFIGLGGWK